jgi:hypothetical protein
MRLKPIFVRLHNTKRNEFPTIAAKELEVDLQLADRVNFNVLYEDGGSGEVGGNVNSGMVIYLQYGWEIHLLATKHPIPFLILVDLDSITVTR